MNTIKIYVYIDLYDLFKCTMQTWKFMCSQLNETDAVSTGKKTDRKLLEGHDILFTNNMENSCV